MILLIQFCVESDIIIINNANNSCTNNEEYFINNLFKQLRYRSSDTFVLRS